MMKLLTLVAALASASMATPGARDPTFCAEWVRQSSEGYDRLTLFRDRALVWKTHFGAQDEVRRKTLDASELQYYCAFFARDDFWSLRPDLRTGLAGEFTSQSAVTLARPDGTRKTIRFDDLSTNTAESAALRSALEGLKGLFVNPLAPASRFTPDVLTPGTLLKRFDGAVFRVRRLEKETGFVEIVGVTQPYAQFLRIDELRFQFSPPEKAP